MSARNLITLENNLRASEQVLRQVEPRGMTVTNARNDDEHARQIMRSAHRRYLNDRRLLVEAINRISPSERARRERRNLFATAAERRMEQYHNARMAHARLAPQCQANNHLNDPRYTNYRGGYVIKSRKRKYSKTRKSSKSGKSQRKKYSKLRKTYSKR